MNEKNDKQASDQQKRAPYWIVKNDGARVISYNIDESERPSGIRIRFKVRVVTGKEAAAADRRQADAIKEYLQWARQYRQSLSTGPTGTASGTPPPP